MDLIPIISLFFYIFGFLYNKDTIGQNFVSFKQPKRLFVLYTNYHRSYNDRYYVSRPLIKRATNKVVVNE